MAFDKRDYKFDYITAEGDSDTSDGDIDDRIRIDKNSISFDEVVELLIDIKHRSDEMAVELFDMCTASDLILFLHTYTDSISTT